MTDDLDLNELSLTGICYAFNLNLTSRVISRYYDNIMKPVGITNNQFSLMSLILLIRKIFNLPPTVANLSMLIGTDHSSMSRNLDKLKKSGYVELNKNTEDKRITIAGLTSHGKEVMKQAFGIWKKVHTDLESILEINPKDLQAELAEIRKGVSELD